MERKASRYAWRFSLLLYCLSGLVGLSNQVPITAAAYYWWSTDYTFSTDFYTSETTTKAPLKNANNGGQFAAVTATTVVPPRPWIMKSASHRHGTPNIFITSTMPLVLLAIVRYFA